MKKKDWATLGEQREPGGRPPAPPPLRVVQQFLNTWNREMPPDWDRLGTPTRAAAWLVGHDLARAPVSLTESERVRLIVLRDNLRDLLLRRDQTGSAAEVAPVLNRLTAPLEVRFDPKGEAHLTPTQLGAYEAIARLVSAVHDAQVSGSWQRLKACRRCGWAFYDGSKNRSGSWCSMTVCGNRQKNRVYRGRRAVTAAVG